MRYGVLCPSFSFWAEFHDNRLMPGMIAFCASWRYFERNSLFLTAYMPILHLWPLRATPSAKANF
jgi:hypothetical protein